MKILLHLIVFVALLSVPMHAQETAGTESKIYRTPEVDSKPELKDGMYTLPLYVSQNFKIPDVHNKKIKLFVGFIIEPDGTMTNVRFIHLSVKDLIENETAVLTEEKRNYEEKELDKMKSEAVRVLTAFTKPWIPAMVNGKPVRCQYNYPINFNLE